MKSIVVYSGGLDSTVLLYSSLVKGNEVKALSVDYGQRHRKELEHAAAITKELGIEHKICDLRAIKDLLAGSSQTSDNMEVPEGHYAEESMKQTVVPNRNMVLLSLATAWAVSTKSDNVLYGAHGGDHAIYPDCRIDFTEAMKWAIQLCDWHMVKLICPFLSPHVLSKAEIVTIGALFKVPFAKTWSCYKGGEKHCGKCGTCNERKESFVLAGVDDPTEYE